MVKVYQQEVSLVEAIQIDAETMVGIAWSKEVMLEVH